MNEPLIEIRNETLIRDIRELAELTGRGLTEAVAEAVRAELKRARPPITKDEKLQAVAEIVRQFNDLPVVGAPLTDDDLYDEHGLPR